MAVAVVGLRQSRRTDLILEAVKKALHVQASCINSSTTIRTITISVKMKNGTGHPRAVVLSLETELELEESTPQ